MRCRPWWRRPTAARRYARASQATWTALWASLFTVPLFVVAGAERAAQDICTVRTFRRKRAARADVLVSAHAGRPAGRRAVGGAWASSTALGVRPITLRIAARRGRDQRAVESVVHVQSRNGRGRAPLGRPMLRSCSGLCAALDMVFGAGNAPAFSLAPHDPASRRAHCGASCNWDFPMGLLIAADILGFALFQLMQVRLGTVDGASTQIVMMLTSFCYMPAVGIAMAGTTLVGQAIGAHHKRLGVQGRQRHHIDCGAVHGCDRRVAGRVGAVGAAVFHQCRRLRRRAQSGGTSRYACCGLPPVINCSMD